MDEFEQDLFAQATSLKGASYAILSTVTYPKPGIEKETTGIDVILFTMDSGYEKLGKDRLRAAGKNPDDFVIGQRAFGERVGYSPVIKHNGENYLQFAVLNPGESTFYRNVAGKRKVVDPSAYGIKPSRAASGVEVRTVKFEHITEMEILGLIEG